MTSDNNKNNNTISLSELNPRLTAIFQFNNKKPNSLINISEQESKIFNFFLISIIKTKNFQNIKKFLKLNKQYYTKIIDHIILNIKKTPKSFHELLSKFLIICIFNSNELSKILKYDKKIFVKKLFELINIFYLNSIIDKNDLIYILKLTIISCLNKEEQDIFNEELLDYKNKTIKDVFYLEIVINFLLSFKYVRKMDTNSFTNIINNIKQIIEEYLLNNYNNIYLLSNSMLFYKLIELSQISLESIDNITQLLVKVYKLHFKIDYYLNDLSDQFLLRNNESILRKNINLIAKNSFLFGLFRHEDLAIKEQNNIFIKNGFVFNDHQNNGIILYNNDSFIFPNESFSSVISFKLIKEEYKDKIIKKNEKDNKKYPIYSLCKKDESVDFIVYIENNILKMNILGKVYELFKDVQYNKTYFLWHFHKGDNKKGTSIFILNDIKIIKKKLSFHKEFYNINIGFEKTKDKKNNNIYKNNFTGIIGTFILFKECFVYENNNPKSKSSEEALIGLKCNYENLIYINYRTEFSNLDAEILDLLNKFEMDNISRFIEVIISTKSITRKDFCCCNKNKKLYKANYFMDKDNDKSMIGFVDENIDFNKNLTTYPVHFSSAFDNFLNNNGIKFLILELNYFIGVVGSYSMVNQKNNEKNEKNEKNIEYEINNKILELKDEKTLYLKLQYICDLFWYCLERMNETEEKGNENDINNFFITLNNLISLFSKNGFKIDITFLSPIMHHLNLLINKNKFFNYFGFIFEYESYEHDDDKVFELLFRTIIVYLDLYNTNFLTTDLFSKILNFDKLYIDDKVKKGTKKTYSLLIRKCLCLSLLNNDDECFLLYIKKLKSYTGIGKICELSKLNYIREEDLSDDSENNNSKLGHKKSFKNTNISTSTSTINITNEDKIKELKNLKLSYKYIKNLYLCLEIDNKAYDILIKLCLQHEENMNDFFNEEFKYLSRIYEITLDNDDNEDNNNNKINTNTDIKNKLIIVELIKALCIRFLDEINYENNYKIIENEKKEKKNLKENNYNSSFRKTMKSSINLNKSISTFSLKSLKKNYTQKRGDNMSYNNLASAQNLVNRKFNITGDSIDSILVNKLEFFHLFTLSPYTFNSFFMSLFRNMKNKEKLKYIKNFNAKKENLYLSEKDFIKITRFYSRIIIQLIQRVGEEEYDTYFMGKYDFFEYVYDKYNDILLNMLDFYEKKKNLKKESKAIVNNLFCSKENAFYFYISIFDNLKKEKTISKGIYVSGSILTKKTDNNIPLDKFSEKVKKNLYDIIDRTLFKYIDPFYFKLLFEIYIKDNDIDNNKFVIETIEYIIGKFYNYEKDESNDLKHINKIIEFNNKNLILLIYKITFYKNKRNYLIQNIKQILLYLYSFLSRTKFVFLKIIFPIEDSSDLKNANKKLILEMILEIYFKLYIEYKKLAEEEDDEEKKKEKENQCLIFEDQIKQLLLIKSTSKTNIDSNIFSLFESFADLEEDGESKKKKKKKNWEYSICYMIDKLSIMESKYQDTETTIINDSKLIKTFKNLHLLKDYALQKYIKEYKQDENVFSVTILFLIKITLFIKKLEKIEKNTDLLNFFIKISELLCEDAQKLQQKYITYNPLASKSESQTETYDFFKNYIINEYKLNKKYNKEELILKIDKDKLAKKYGYAKYDKFGKVRLFTGKDYTANARSSFYKINSYSYGEDSNFSRNSIRDERDERHSSGSIVTESVKSFGKSSNNKTLLSETPQPKSENFDFFRVSSAFFLKKRENRKLLEYKIVPKFSKNYVRNYFSLYFLKLLCYDEDFINVKKIYYYLYNKDINDINKYNIDYPSKLKNRLGNNYAKHFLKKDFNFFSNECFKYSHKNIFDKNFTPKTKNLFPIKEILEKFDYAHKDILVNKVDKSVIMKNCELITYEGSIFGHIYLFQNCILFKSDLENDKRKNEDSLEFVCCSLEFDFLLKNKTKIIELREIKEVICKKFLYLWISLEIFMKNGQSHLFNFFSEEVNNEVLDLLKYRGIPVIKNVKEYFDKEEFSKKWKEGKISTYNYILILNKFSSRTYNDSNQYPIMPWIFMHNKLVRDFDIPMSIQDEETKAKYLKIQYNSSDKENRWHSNHYSTSAYICYYLMRTNPYTNSMIKFQSNNFDVPDRQFFDLGQTLILCEKNNNNREPIPEMYTIPEIYINLNDNDFGKQTQQNQGRIHNVEFKPYANNAYDFIYKFKYKLNTDEKINSKINEWFDFIFGINQYNKENYEGTGFRNFNKYCYAQNINFKYIISNLKKNRVPEKKIFSDIKSILGMIISFGQCPFQLLTYEHPKKVYNKAHDISNSLDKMNEQELLSNSSNIDNESIDNKDNGRKIVQILYDENNKRHNIIYFKKSICDNYLYCICNNKEIEIYQKEGKPKEYLFKKKINVNKNYLLFKKNNNGYPILKPQYLFCELKEEYFIFCRFLDNTIRLIQPNSQPIFLLDSFVTAIIRINNKEFITGDIKGKLYHWHIDLDDILNINLKLIKKINSNNNSITSIVYNEQLNVIAASDKNAVIIRSFYDFEFLSYIDVSKNEENNEDDIIVDIKISNYDLLYVLINKGNDNYKLKGYSLNGICFGEFKEKITNFDLTDDGKVLVGLANVGVVNVLNPINFKLIFSRYINQNDCLFYHFYFEKPNILYFGFKDKEGSKIRLIVLNSEEVKYFS